MSSKSVIVIGGGLAGLSAAVALADAGFRVRVLEKRPYLGGRASSYTLPNGEHIDNCQHVTLGCCTNLEDFYRRAGAADQIAFYGQLYFVDRLGRRSIMQAAPLPAPLHLAPSLLLYSSLTWSEKRAIGHAMLAIAADRARGPSARGARSMLDWLRQHGQSPAAIERFWGVVLVSALNEELGRIDARYGLDVFWKAFLSNRSGYRVGIPRVPLGELYDGCRAAIERRGGEVALRAPVQQVLVANGRVAGVEMGYDYEETADYYVLAVPHDAVLELLPPHVVACEPAFANLRNLKTSPITSVHLWFDRQVMSEPFLTLLDRTTQWIFNKSLLSSAHSAVQQVAPPFSAASVYADAAAAPSRAQPVERAMVAGVARYGAAPPFGAASLEAPASSQSGLSAKSQPQPRDRDQAAADRSSERFAAGQAGQYLQLVISASYSLIPIARQEIIDLCLAELREVVPESRRARVLKATVIKETAATFSPGPGSDRWRPAQQSPLKNLFLAGDWTATGWPATMEGAVRGGYLAAEAILAAAGAPRRFVVPDLAPEFLARLL